MITIKIFEFNYFSENCYLLHDETKDAVIIDCGALFPQEHKTLTEYIAQQGLSIKHLLCTHLHVDHVFGNAFIYKNYGLKPMANKLEMELLPSPAVQAQMFGMDVQTEDVPMEEFISDGDKICFGNSELKTILVPGHSPGSIVFYSKEEGFAIVGDVLFNGSIGRTDLWGGSHETLIKAIKEKLLVLPDETVVYPGHGNKTKIIDERRHNPFL